MTSSPSSSPKHHKNKKRVCKEKLRTIMEAASALTALGDEESSDNQSRGNSPVPKEPGKTKATSKKDDKRFLPDHKKPDAALTFPEKVRFTTSFVFHGIGMPHSPSTKSTCGVTGTRTFHVGTEGFSFSS